MKREHNYEIEKKLIIVVIFILLFFLIKLIYLYFLPLPLSYDEAYYWDWSKSLDFGYYNKPPMIGWIIRIFTEIFGDTEFGVRIPALICIILTIFFSFLIIWKYFKGKNAFLFLFTFSFIPALTVYSFIMTIDPLLILFWILSLYFFLSYLKDPSYKNVYFTGIFIGLGLLTKQTMFAFLALTFLYLLIFKRDLLFKKETFFLFLIPLLMYTPNIYWNYKNQFVLLKHTEEHFSRYTYSFYSFLKFMVDLISAYTPLFLLFLYSGLVYFKNFLKDQPQFSLNFLYFLSFPFIFFLLFLSFFIKLNANWILPFVLTGYIFLFSYSSFSSVGRYFLLVNIILAIILSVIICFLGYFPQKFPEPMQVLLEKFRGWDFLAKRVEKYYQSNIPLVVENRAIASVLAFYLNSHPKVYVIQFKKYPENQYHLWRDIKSLNGKEILVVKKGSDPPYYLKNSEKLDEFVIKITLKRFRHFSIWRGILNL